MIANVTMPGGRVERMTLPRPIWIDGGGKIQCIYVGRRTARLVVEYVDGRFEMVRDENRGWFVVLPGVRAAIDAVKEPRPL